MFRAVLVWVLTAGFLVTAPVTGAGQCPCRFVKPMRQQIPPAAPQPVTRSCKCCEVRVQDATEQPVNGSRSLPEPTDGPCDHNFKADAVSGVGASDRAGVAHEDGGTNPAVGDGTNDRPHSVSVAHGGVIGHALPSRSGPHLIRFVHAFRC